MSRVEFKSGLDRVNHYRLGEKWGLVCDTSEKFKEVQNENRKQKLWEIVDKKYKD